MLEGGAGSACDPCFEGAGYYLAIGGAAATQNYAHIVKEVRKHGWDVNLLDHTEDMSLISVRFYAIQIFLLYYDLKRTQYIIRIFQLFKW